MDLNSILNSISAEEELANHRRSRRVQVPIDELRRRLQFYESHHEGFEATDEHLRTMVDIFHNHRNVFLTGGAGTGKTTFVRTVLMPEMDHRNLGWSVTASTGIAGSHLDGKTLHSFMGIGLGPDWVTRYPASMRKFMDCTPGNPTVCPQDMPSDELQAWYEWHFHEWNYGRSVKPFIREGVKNRLKAHEIILIDEVSMCGGNGLLGYIDYMLKNIRGDDRPFGGIQMIFIGDFAQLPPVTGSRDSLRPDWAFMSDAWSNAKVKTCQLTKVFRQGDQDFVAFLNRIRQGIITQEDREYAKRFMRNDMTSEETRLYTCLVPTNAQADRINSQALQGYPEPTYPLEAEFEIVPGLQQMTHWEENNTHLVKERLIKSLEPRRLSKKAFLRIGLPVMFTVNDPGGEFVNGTLGFVREVKTYPRNEQHPEDRDRIIIGIPRKDPNEEERTVTLYRHNYSRSRDQDPRESIQVPEEFKATPGAPLLGHTVARYPVVRQFPLIPATAITIHKCVDKNTLIPTADGLLRIGDLCEMSPMPEVAGAKSLNPAQEPFVGSREYGYHITTKRGFCISCSERHPMRVVSDTGEDWVKAPDLKEGDKLRMRHSTRAEGKGEFGHLLASEFDHFPQSMSSALAWLLGVIASSGSTDTEDDAFELRHVEDISDRISVACEMLFGGSDDPFSLPGVTSFLRRLGLSDRADKSRVVPHTILSSRVHHQAAFVRGVADACASVTGEVRFRPLPTQLVHDLQTVMLNIGVISDAMHLNSGLSELVVTGSNIVEFSALIGFSEHSSMKPCAFIAGLRDPIGWSGWSSAGGWVDPTSSYPKELGVKIAQSLLSRLRSDDVKFEISPRDYDEKERENLLKGRLTSVIAGDKYLEDRHIQIVAELIPGLESETLDASPYVDAAVNGGFIDEIVGIRRVHGDMRDICVPGEHAFIGNGFLNHNSQGMSMDRCILALARSFAAGQVYVGLSRLKSPEGLVLSEEGFEAKVDPLVAEFYRNVNESTSDTDSITYKEEDE